MAFLARSLRSAPLPRALPSVTSQPRRFAHQSYGNEQSGHEQGLHEKNPKKDLEHPGPESPVATDSKSSSTQQSASSSGGAQPKISTPKSAAEDSDPDVRKHNEEMANRADRSANQLSESDNKVDKKFWKGDVGDMKGEK